MTPLDAYRDILRELDKYESPTFTPVDFNYFYNKAVSQYIDSNYLRIDLIVKDSEDLASFIVPATGLTIDSDGVMEMPSDFRHLLSLKIKVRFKQNIGRYKKYSASDSSTIYEFWPERMKSGQKGFRNRSAYGKPNFRRFYYEIYSQPSGSVQNVKIKILFDSSVVDVVSLSSTANAFVDYVKQPQSIALTSPSVFTPSFLEFNTSTTRNNIYYQIANVCRSLFLENIESARTPVAMQETASQQ
jgi:hypothetical protein